MKFQLNEYINKKNLSFFFCQRMDNSINNSYIKIKKESYFDSDTESIDIITESYDERQDNKMLQSRMQQSESIPHSIKTGL